MIRRPFKFPTLVSGRVYESKPPRPCSRLESIQKAKSEARMLAHDAERDPAMLILRREVAA